MLKEVRADECSGFTCSHPGPSRGSKCSASLRLCTYNAVKPGGQLPKDSNGSSGLVTDGPRREALPSAPVTLLMIFVRGGRSLRHQ